jgi:hypothetical protein
VKSIARDYCEHPHAANEINAIHTQRIARDATIFRDDSRMDRTSMRISPRSRWHQLRNETKVHAVSNFRRRAGRIFLFGLRVQR